MKTGEEQGFRPPWPDHFLMRGAFVALLKSADYDKRSAP
jgi:hypothetical protein